MSLNSANPDTGKIVSYMAGLTIKDKAIKFLEEGEDYLDNLSAKDQEQIQRLVQANRIYGEHDSIARKQVAKMLRNYYKGIGKEYSLSTCENDVRLAEQVFGKFVKYDKDFLRHIITQKLLQLGAKAEHVDKDLKTAILAYEKAAKIQHLDQVDARGPDPTQLQPPNVFFINKPQIVAGKNFDPDAEKKVRKEVMEYLNLTADEVKLTED